MSRVGVKIAGTCDQCPTLDFVERPSGGILGDIWVRGNHVGANVWTGFQVFMTEAGALAGDSTLSGSAGSEFPEGSGRWPVTDNGANPPDTSAWVLGITLPETAPSDLCYVVWKWTTAYASSVLDAVCDVLQRYTDAGKSLEGAAVQCGEPGAQHPEEIVFLTTGGDLSAKMSAQGYAGRSVSVRVGIRIAKGDDVAAQKKCQMWAAAVCAVVNENRDELGSGPVEFEQVSSADAVASGYYTSEVRFTVRADLKREG